MIKVIAADMDGTLLNESHRLAPETVEAINKACNAGIRFIIATGRNFRGAMDVLKNEKLTCDYLVGSGAEVRNPDLEVVYTAPINIELCKEVYRTLQSYPVSVIFCADYYDYRIGDEKEIEESFIRQMKVFHIDRTWSDEQVRADPLYKNIRENTKVISDISQLETAGVPVYKIFLYSDDILMLDQIKEKLEPNDKIAVAASFATNLEITDVNAQKGPVLKQYIESLGYTMDEVMALGDSMNDYSMLSMDFGATVAMANAMPEIKAVAKYTTKTNEEHGVAHAIYKVLERMNH